MEITPQSKIHDLLTHFPQLEEEIIRTAPPFENLRNPLLRRTVTRLTTLEQAARIGGVNALEWVNHLRRLAGQAELTAGAETAVPDDLPPASPADPPWVQAEPQFVVDGTQLLARGEVPLNHINRLLPQLEAGRCILLITNFEPQPMIEAMQKQNRRVFHKRDESKAGRHLTYIQ
ncbi:MAG: DUF1858 domain-containing protein [Chloroflexota bacterium]